MTTNRLHTAENNRLSLWGFILGVAALLFYDIGAIPLTAVGLSIAGLATHDPDRHRNRWQGWTGLALGVVCTLLYLRWYGHI